MTEPRRMVQLYVCIYHMINPAEPNKEMLDRHHAYLYDLLDRKILLGSGSMKDENDKRHCGGINILRAPNLATAKEIAEQDPFVRAGDRGVEVLPWQRTTFGDGS